MTFQLTRFDVDAIATLQAAAQVDAQGVVPTVAAIAEVVGRELENTRKTLKAFEGAGRVKRDDLGDKQIIYTLTDDGRAVLAAWDRAHDTTAPQGSPGAELPLELIDPDPDLNPRKDFDPVKLDELAETIRSKGVFTPILVRPSLTPGRFRVVAGERRRQASVLAGKTTIPVVVRDLDDADALETAIMENIQRADMSELEEARGFARIIASRRGKDAALSLKDAKQLIADANGKTVRFVELRLQLLDLPQGLLAALEAGDLSVTEARKFLQSRPKLIDLTPRQWLIALEVLDAQERKPLPKEHDYEPTLTACRADAADDADVDTLIKKTVLAEPAELWGDDGYLTGRYAIRVTSAGIEQLCMRFGADVREDDLREKALDAAVGETGLPEGFAGGYLAEWLNGPFDPTPERAAEIAAQREANERQIAEQEAAREAEAKARQDQLAEGLLRLSRANDLIAEAWVAPVSPVMADDLVDLLSQGGKPLPWRATDRGAILASNGAIVIGGYPPHVDPSPDLIARVRIMAASVNTLAGLPTPNPLPDAEPTIPCPYCGVPCDGSAVGDHTEDCRGYGPNAETGAEPDDVDGHPIP